MKKILACMLSTLIFLGSCINISAAQLPQQENSIIPVDQTAFSTMNPGDVRFVGLSVSYIEHRLSAYRQANGSVEVIINETFHTVRGYYEVLATDLSGEYFIPSKNTVYYTSSEGIYSIFYPADSVSSDGYVYLRFAIAPIDGNQLYNEQYYKIPVDYNENNTANNNYIILEPGKQFTSIYNTQSATFDANAIKLENNSVEVLINLENTNSPLWITHNATSKDGDIFMPFKNRSFRLTSGPLSNKDYRFIVPENSISNNGYIYLEIQFEVPSGIISSDYIKLPIMTS
ncbi:hypothetical protein [Thomasclavelia sp.]